MNDQNTIKSEVHAYFMGKMDVSYDISQKSVEKHSWKKILSTTGTGITVGASVGGLAGGLAGLLIAGVGEIILAPAGALVGGVATGGVVLTAGTLDRVKDEYDEYCIEQAQRLVAQLEIDVIESVCNALVDDPRFSKILDGLASHYSKENAKHMHAIIKDYYKIVKKQALKDGGVVSMDGTIDTSSSLNKLESKSSYKKANQALIDQGIFAGTKSFKLRAKAKVKAKWEQAHDSLPSMPCMHGE